MKAMKRVLSAGNAAAILCLAAGMALAQDEPENTARYIGGQAVQDGRAVRAGIGLTLPLSCPPFYLRDNYGQIIDPNVEPGVSRPVSTRQTCGECHDYARITHGYHFQMGKDELYPSSKAGDPVPLSKGPGFYGKWLPLYQRELAPKFFTDPAPIEMTSYQWVAECGVCHPGGGPAEYDREFKRYDDVMGADTGIAAALDGDYYKARWNESGVVEADCFICHLDTYDYSTRAQQLKKLNFRWAATAAAGFGVVEGSVKDNQVPRLAYRKEIFGPDGKIQLAIRRPNDRACQSCHEMSSIEKRGTAWHDDYMQDVHTGRGLRCTDCHPGDIRHNFAKGHSLNLTVRDDLDDTGPSCKSCHESGTLGAPRAVHRGIPAVHFNAIACESCHITRRPFLSARTVDTLTGKVVELPNTMDESDTDGFAFGAWWGKAAAQQPDAGLFPFSSDEIANAAARTLDAEPAYRIVEQPGGAVSEEARGAMLAALGKTPGLEKPFMPVCVFRGTSYAMDAGKMVALPDTLVPKRVGAIAEYPVTYARAKEEDAIKPVGYQVVWYWLAVENGHAHPIQLGEMKAAYDFLADAQPAHCEAGVEKPLAIFDDNNDRWPEANTDDEIGLAAWAIHRTLTRFKNPTLICIKGAVATTVSIEDGTRLDAAPEQGAYLTLRDSDEASHFETPFKAVFERNRDCLIRPFRERVYWNIVHGVEPVTQALGAQSCTQCHARQSQFFRGRIAADTFTQDGVAMYASAYHTMHYTSLAITCGEIRERFVKPFAPWIVLGLFAAMLLHAVLFGPHQPTGGYTGPDMIRFRLHERFSHAVAMTAVGFLAVTGCCFLLGKSDPLGAWARPAHTIAGYAGAVGALLLLVVWMFSMFPGRGDLRWLRGAGGYFGGHKAYPAGKFNAGQKLLFWFTMFLMTVLAYTGILMAQPSLRAADAQSILYAIHDLAALFMILALMAHIYLAAILNPHSLRSLFGGRVSRAWANEHHSLWKKNKAVEGDPSAG